MLTRRRFLQALGAGAFAAAAPRGVRAFAGLPCPFTPPISLNPQCELRRPIGTCKKWFFVKGTLILHWLPVLYVEVNKSPFKLGSLPGIGSIGPGVRTGQNWEQAYETRIWDIPEWVRLWATGGVGCSWCPGYIAKTIGSFRNAAGKAFWSKLDLGSACGTPAAIQKLVQKFASLLACYGIVKLYYDSAGDLINWRLGCRDLPWSALGAIPGSIGCAVAGAFGGLSIYRPGAITGFSSIPAGLNPCVGTWGTLLPRQMRSQTVNEVVASAYAAYRAIHIATYTLGVIPYEASVDTGHLQPATIPNPAAPCFSPGTNPAIVDWASLVAGVVSATSPYAEYRWIWWTPVWCCKSSWFGGWFSCLTKFLP